MRQIRNKEIIKVKDLEPKRDYIYIDDIVTAIVAAVSNHKGLQIYNLGSGISYSVKELIRIMQDVMESDLDTFSEELRRKDEIMNTVADISLAKKELGWIPKWQLAAGLKEIKKKH
jgi:nucleoside-diphosphate-sugar epimerase